ncbi:hypothetical protein D3C73_649390 [compost metagenome]
MKILTSAYDGKGKAVHLGAQLGRGGEGSVFEIRGQSNLVAKLYHNPIDIVKQQKVMSMVALKTDSLLRIATWPLDILRPNSKGNIVGFVMPKLSGKEIHKLYGPKTRLLEFPHATFSFLVHTAANLARSFAAIHDNGHVIGDINHGNFYVSDQGTVMLVDCDSFQIVTPKDQYRCEVGVPMYQPPEFQGISSFRQVARTPNHDNFGLAVFIFLLLFMGRHPFSGKFLGAGEMPIEKAIKEFRFAYSHTAARKLIQQPPGTLSLSTLPSSMVNMFERAFSPEGVKEGCRPTAQEWIQALEALSVKLTKCTRNEGHNYLNSLAACPWCEVEAQTGVVLFHATHSVSKPSEVVSFNLETVWSQAKSVQSPGPPPSLPNSSSYIMQPSARLLNFKKQQYKKAALATLPIWLAILYLFIVPDYWPQYYIRFFPQDYLWIPVGAILLSIGGYAATNSSKVFRLMLQKEHEAALKGWKVISDRWSKEAGNEAFVRKMNELEKVKADYLDLTHLRKMKLSGLQAQQRDRQLIAHLQHYRLEDADIAGLGPSRKSTLTSFGIETAADITITAIQQVPGFGATYTQKLLDWRSLLEKSFRFNPTQGVPPSDILALDREMAYRRILLERELQNGPTQLIQIANQIKVRRNALWTQIEEIAQVLTQIELDVKRI